MYSICSRCQWPGRDIFAAHAAPRQDDDPGHLGARDAPEGKIALGRLSRTRSFVTRRKSAARAAAEPEAVDEIDLIAAAGFAAGTHQDRRQQARRAAPVADQDLAGRKGRDLTVTFAP